MNSVNKLSLWVTIGLFLCQIVFSILILKTEEAIPTHWNFAGQIDAYSSAPTILLLPLISLSVWGLLWFAKSHPQYWNLPPKVKEDKKVREVVIEMFNVMLMLIMIIMTNICYCAWKRCQLKYIWLEVVLISIIPIYYIVRVNRLS